MLAITEGKQSDGIIRTVVDDHVTAIEALTEVEAALEPAERTRLFNSLAKMLRAQILAEEKTLLPCLLQDDSCRGPAALLHKEHVEINAMLLEISAISPRSKTWTAKLSKLADLLDMHMVGTIDLLKHYAEICESPESTLALEADYCYTVYTSVRGPASVAKVPGSAYSETGVISDIDQLIADNYMVESRKTSSVPARQAQ